MIVFLSKSVAAPHLEGLHHYKEHLSHTELLRQGE